MEPATRLSRGGGSRLDPACPAPLAEAGFSLRLMAPPDEPALRAMYVRHRRDEFAPLGLPEVQLRALLESQFSIQSQQYAQTYANMSVHVLWRDGDVAGRLMLGEADGMLRVLDILIAPEWRGRGIGGALLAALLAQAGCEVALNVAKGNPARRLYERLGFRVTQDVGVAFAMVWSPAVTA